MKNVLLVLITLLASGCQQLASDPSASLESSGTLDSSTRLESLAMDRPGPDSIVISVGSCLRQWKPQPIWQSISDLAPTAHIFAGDNMYADVGSYLQHPDPQRIAMAYQDLMAQSEYADFLAQAAQQGTTLLATWDDHDYGLNDAGADYPFRSQAKQYFSDFFQLDPAAIGSSENLGTYYSANLVRQGLNIQLIMLDTRSYRSPLVTAAGRSVCPPTGRIPNTNPDATLLGHAQWQWLQQQLDQPADLRLVVSSIQVIPDQHCFEKWANFPAERQRLLALLAATKGVILFSGDRHLAEISVLTHGFSEPLYELTSSGLNSAMGDKSLGGTELNQYRAIEQNFLQDNFGTLVIEPNQQTIAVKLQIRDQAGRVKRQVSTHFQRPGT